MANYGEGLKGAGGGAATGAALGSLGGPVGTGIGAIAGGVIGGLGGLFGGGEDDEQRKRLMDYYAQVQNRQAPQAGAASQSALSDFRGNQSALANRLEAVATGRAPSLVTEQLNQATNRGQAAAQSIAQSGRGNAALANLTAANNMQALSQAAAGQAAMGRLQEVANANQALGGVLQGARGQDEANSQFNAQQQNFRDQANLEAKLRTMGLNDQAIAQVFAQISGVNAKPTFGDQLLAGGTGALGMLVSQQKKGAPSGP